MSSLRGRITKYPNFSTIKSTEPPASCIGWYEMCLDKFKTLVSIHKTLESGIGICSRTSQYLGKLSVASSEQQGVNVPLSRLSVFANGAKNSLVKGMRITLVLLFTFN